MDTFRKFSEIPDPLDAKILDIRDIEFKLAKSFDFAESELRELEKSSKTCENIKFQPKPFLKFFYVAHNFIKMTCAKYEVRTPNRLGE